MTKEKEDTRREHPREVLLPGPLSSRDGRSVLLYSWMRTDALAGYAWSFSRKKVESLFARCRMISENVRPWKCAAHTRGTTVSLPSEPGHPDRVRISLLDFNYSRVKLRLRRNGNPGRHALTLDHVSTENSSCIKVDMWIGEKCNTSGFKRSRSTERKASRVTRVLNPWNRLISVPRNALIERTIFQVHVLLPYEFGSQRILAFHRTRRSICWCNLWKLV